MTVIGRDDLGDLGFDLLVGAEHSGALAQAHQRRGRRRRRSRGRRGPPDRAGPADLREGHDRGHDSARGGNRGPRDQPDEGVLRRPGDHHPRAAPRTWTRRAAARRADARARSGGAGPRLGDPQRRSRDWHDHQRRAVARAGATDRDGLRPPGFRRSWDRGVVSAPVVVAGGRDASAVCEPADGSPTSRSQGCSLAENASSQRDQNVPRSPRPLR